MNHTELLKRSLPPCAYDTDAPMISVETAAEGNALDAAMLSGDGLLDEFDPRTMYSLVPDFERVFKIVPAPIRNTLSPGVYGYGPSDIASFARASTATYIDANGVLQTAAANVPRFQNGQLVIEAAATNLLPNSEQFNNWVRLGAGAMTANAMVSPRGDMTADLLTDSDTSNLTYWDNVISVPANDTASRVFSVYLYRGSAARTTVVCYAIGGSAPLGGGYYTDVTWATMTLATNCGGHVTPVPGLPGWYRVDCNLINNGTGNTAFYSRIFAAGALSGVAATGTVYAWGAQTEVVGAGVTSPTSYIPTTNAAVTRAADACDVWVPQTLDQRRAAISAKMNERGGQSRGYYLALAARYGYPSATITEFRQSTCNDTCDMTLIGPNDLFVWVVTLPASGGQFVATCDGPCDQQLGSYGHSLVEAAINEDSPAHTTVLFAYV